jgi:hypothetical protein
LSGIDEGELIIIGPFSEVRNLQDGDDVRVINDDDEASGGFLEGLRGARSNAESG